MTTREEAAAKAGMRHYGYTDEQIASAEQPVAHTEECEFIEQVGWQCESEDGKPLHPESVELNGEFEMAQVHIAAADAHDAAHGIHRVTLDDATVERAARALMFSVWKLDNAWDLASDNDRSSYIFHAKAILAAAVEAGQ